MTKGDRVWGFHPCGQCRTQGCVSLEAERDRESTEWNPDRRSNLLAMPETITGFSSRMVRAPQTSTLASTD